MERLRLLHPPLAGTLTAAVAASPGFLHDVLLSAAADDPFTARLLALHEATRDATARLRALAAALRRPSACLLGAAPASCATHLRAGGAGRGAGAAAQRLHG